MLQYDTDTQSWIQDMEEPGDLAQDIYDRLYLANQRYWWLYERCDGSEDSPERIEMNRLDGYMTGLDKLLILE